jgi:ABC-type Fe3+/spermidine/putrescine transport system ATPase subunit
MQEELKEIQRRVGTAFVYVTHDQLEALAMADRIAVLRDGQIEQIGTGLEIYESPQTAFVASFIGDTNLLQGTVASVVPEGILVTSEAGQFRAPRHRLAGEGVAVQVSIRPERIHVEPFDHHLPSPSNAWPAHVRTVTFKGAYVEYRLLTPTGQLLLARMPAGRMPVLSPGVAVVARWAIEDSIVLPN